MSGVPMVKKGITAVVATVLLLMMTVAAAGLAYMWITDMQKEIQDTTQAQYQQQQVQSQALLSIDSMWNTSGNISFVLRNVGTYAFDNPTKFSVYYDGMPIPKIDVTYTPNSPLSPGNTISVDIKRAFANITASRTVRVVTDVGTEISYRCAVSSSSQNYC